MSDCSNFCGIDLAKNHFRIHAVDQHGIVLLHKSLTRSKLLTKIANMPAMRIGLEACGGAQYWARTFRTLSPCIIWSLLHNQTEYENFAA